MTQPIYRMSEGSLHEKFDDSRNKIQMMAGGFANGKTSASIVLKVLKIARDYPGANILVARSTYPKLNDTIRKEFFKWCPSHWIKSATKEPNNAELVNGTIVNFRYIQQQGRNNESSTSNLLSANYDLVVVDQIEDPEISYKDFLDLLGRLRGMAKYIGDDPTMPRTGPRWLVLTCNPTRNWVYRKLVMPLHTFLKHGRKTADLIVDGKSGQPLMDLFEGSTYENKDNLEEDYISTLESAYTGVMKERYLLGNWGAYEGLVYPQFSEETHIIPHDKIVDYYWGLMAKGIRPVTIESYDHGLAQQACYLLGFTDNKGNVFVMDGYYEKEKSPEEISNEINDRRANYRVDRAKLILADPAIFRRGSADTKTVGRTTADMFQECGINMERGNNDIMNGIHKVQEYLTVRVHKQHPLHDTMGAPFIYFSDKLEFLFEEFVDYYWKKTKFNEQDDTPMDRRDHGMDALKYLLSRRPSLAIQGKKPDAPPEYMSWHEFETENGNTREHRYG